MYRTLLKNRNYTKLLSANMINRLGDGIDSIAFTWLTYALTKNASLSAIVFAANVLPTVLFQPLAAPFVDRMQKQKVMVWSDLLRGLSLSGFLLLFLTDFLQPWMFVAFTFLFNSIEAFRIPAGVSYLPKVLANEELDEGINFNQISSQVCMIAGTAAGGVLVAIAPGLAIGLDLLSFFLSACLIGAMKVEEHLDMAITQTNYWENLKGGVLYFCKNKLFLLFVSGALLCNALATILSSLSAAYISGTLHKSSEYLAYADILTTLSSLLLLFFYPRIQKLIRPSFVYTWCSLGIWGLFYLILAVLPSLNGGMTLPVWIGLFCIQGCGMGIFQAFLNTTFVKIVEPEYLARAAGFFNSAGSAIMPVLSFLLAGIVHYIKIPMIFLGTGIFSLLLLFLFKISRCGEFFDREISKLK